jgi:NAD+ synthase (glutamine-hydrolysing)
MFVRVAAAALNQTPLDWKGNLANMDRAMTLAASLGVDVLCLPELCITGYGCEDQFNSRDLLMHAYQMLHVVATYTNHHSVIVSVGLPILHKNAVYNAAALLYAGRILGLVPKQHLAGDGIHYEPRWFKPWPAKVISEYPEAGNGIPIGDIVFDVDGLKIGFEICEDAWVPDRPGIQLSKRGVDVILNPSASHFAFGKHEIRKRFVIEGSRAFSCTYVYANLLGNEAGRVIYDGSAFIASGGKLLAQGERFSFQDVALTNAIVDVSATRTSQMRAAGFEPNLDESPKKAFCHAGHTYSQIPDKDIEEQAYIDPAPWESSEHIKEQEFMRAASLGLFDYLRKSRMSGFLVSMSGGADSAACATLVKCMVDLAIADLSTANRVADRLLGRLNSCWTSEDLIKSILTCVYQSTENSSEVTHNAAKSVSEELGANFYSVNIDNIISEYRKQFDPIINKSIGWDTDDLALQNIQARVRSPGVWYYANIKHFLLLCTSNRSEAAVGYCTMDGDTSGSLAPLAGIDKDFIQQWLQWMSYECLQDDNIKPVHSLELVTKQMPTAELRPGGNQTDEDDLMPYRVLNVIEKLAIRDKKSPLEILNYLEMYLSKANLSTIASMVEKFFRLWSRNQWKRERYAVSFHYDDENLDPRSWCRFPVLSGGFTWEVGEMWQYVHEKQMGVVKAVHES